MAMLLVTAKGSGLNGAFAAGPCRKHTHTVLLCPYEPGQAFRSGSDIRVSSDSHAVFRPFLQIFQKVRRVFRRNVRGVVRGGVLSVRGPVVNSVLCYDPVLILDGRRAPDHHDAGGTGAAAPDVLGRA